MNDRDKLKEIFAVWDELDSAVNRIVTALPFQMTEAAERLEVARRKMRGVIWASTDEDRETGA